MQRIWDADDESSVAIRSSAEAAGTAFGRSFIDAESPDTDGCQDADHRDIRHRAGEIVDKVTAKPDVPFWVKVTALLELATYEASRMPDDCNIVQVLTSLSFLLMEQRAI